MSWHGQINRTIWEIQELVRKKPEDPRLRQELLRAHFLQHFEFDRAFHVPRDDRTFLFLQEKPSPTCLLLHGAKGTPAEMRELGNFLHSKDYTVFCPRFSRTDTKDQMVSWESWVTEAKTALETVVAYSEESYVIGLSLGGTIGMILSNFKPVKGVVLLSPALYSRGGLKNRLYELGRAATPTLFYRMAGWDGEVLKAMDYAKRTTKKIEVPVLALQARDDKHLSNKGLKFIRRRAAHPRTETTILPFGSHVLTRGQAKDEVFNRICKFLEEK
jgi:carboxylesterase